MPSLAVAVTDESGRTIRGSAALAEWLARAAPGRASGYVSIALIPDRAMRALNKKFRRVDRVTDVLSFPREKAPARGLKPRGPGRKSQASLGDIAIATGLARRQAKELRHPFATEIRILALHGLLHLLGYDHEVDRGRMRRVEERLRRKAGLPAGLIARTAPAERGRAGAKPPA